MSVALSCNEITLGANEYRFERTETITVCPLGISLNSKWPKLVVRAVNVVPFELISVTSAFRIPRPPAVETRPLSDTGAAVGPGGMGSGFEANVPVAAAVVLCRKLPSPKANGEGVIAEKLNARFRSVVAVKMRKFEVKVTL